MIRGPSETRAAGGVLWRVRGDVTEVAVVHRRRYDDWSLPKGHLERGEHPAVAAVREITEETGYAATLGRWLGQTHYEVAGRAKQVRYWAARAGGGRFVANHETDELAWLPVQRARERLTYDGDRKILTALDAGEPQLSTMLLVRHAKAGQRDGVDDGARELTATGRAQAAALVPVLRAFGVTAVHAAQLRRCAQTASAAADALGIQVRLEPALPEAVYAGDREGGQRRLAEIRDTPGVPVVVSQDGVIPDVLRSWGADGDLRTPVAAVWVASSRAGRMVSLHRLTED